MTQTIEDRTLAAESRLRRAGREMESTFARLSRDGSADARRAYLAAADEQRRADAHMRRVSRERWWI